MENNILSLIPQKPPFVMVSQLLSCTEGLTKTIFLVAAENVLVDGGLLTEAGLIENIAQTAAAGAGYISRQNGGEVRAGFIGNVRNLEVFALPAVGDLLETEVEIENEIFDVTLIAGTVKCRGQLLATCKMKIFLQPEL